MSQDYPNLDVWVIDDCSTEDITLDKKYCLHDEIDWLQVRKEEVGRYYRYEYKEFNSRQLYWIKLSSNGGPSRARNIGIANALQNGTYLVQVLDSDDVMYPNKVTELIKPILEDPERVAGVYGDYNIVGPTGAVRYESKPPFDAQRLFSGECHIHSGCLINSLALRPFGANFYPEDMRVCEDFALWIRILKSHSWVFTHVAKPLTLVRSHANDSTNSVSKDIWERDYNKVKSYIRSA